MGGSSRTGCEGPYFTQKWVPIFTKSVWRIFSPGFMISEMNLWKFEHYFWKFRHYFSSTLMLKLMETLFVKLLCRTPETVRNFALKVLNLDRCGEKLKQVPFSQSWSLSSKFIHANTAIGLCFAFQNQKVLFAFQNQGTQRQLVMNHVICRTPAP